MSQGRRRVGHPSARQRLSAGVAVGLALTLAACSTASGDGPKDVVAAMQARQQAAAQAAEPAGAQPGAAGSVPAAATCSPAADASYPPLAGFAAGSPPAGSWAAKVKARGYLVVGVSGDTRLLGYRDSLAGGNFKGFDIELAEAVGRAIFGASGKVRFRVITAGQRFPLVNKDVTDDLTTSGVDLVARAVSTTCDRWNLEDPAKSAVFSASYFVSAQRLLVRRDGKVTSIKQLPQGSKVCAPTGSTSLATLAKFPNVTPVAAEIHSDCLALWQEGRVDAITGDDAILAGFVAQDPHAEVVGEDLDLTHYAFAVGKGHKDFVRFINAAMAGPEFRAAWTQAYQKNLAGPLGPKTQPAPNYSRTP
jgi:polar amino acid transport system substrate-binding protein